MIEIFVLVDERNSIIFQETLGPIKVLILVRNYVNNF